jgi:hypothetical protein
VTVVYSSSEDFSRPLSGLDGRAIGAARKQAIAYFSGTIEFVGQKPSDDKENHDDAQRDQRTALAVILVVIVRHVAAFD